MTQNGPQARQTMNNYLLPVRLRTKQKHQVIYIVSFLFDKLGYILKMLRRSRIFAQAAEEEA